MFDAREVIDALEALRDILQDFSPFFERVRDEFYIVQIEHIFDTDGLGNWPNNTRPNPILRDTGELYDSYTNRNHPDFVEYITGTEAAFDSSVIYADSHEVGYPSPLGGYVPARPVPGLIDFDDPELDRIGQEWFDEIEKQVQEILDRAGVSI